MLYFFVFSISKDSTILDLSCCNLYSYWIQRIKLQTCIITFKVIKLYYKSQELYLKLSFWKIHLKTKKNDASRNRYMHSVLAVVLMLLIFLGFFWISMKKVTEVVLCVIAGKPINVGVNRCTMLKDICNITSTVSKILKFINRGYIS